MPRVAPRCLGLAPKGLQRVGGRGEQRLIDEALVGYASWRCSAGKVKVTRKYVTGSSFSR
jgi:hypothetical protein